VLDSRKTIYGKRDRNVAEVKKCNQRSRLIYPFQSTELPSMLRARTTTNSVANWNTKPPKCSYLNRHDTKFLLPLLKRDFKLDALGQTQRLPSPT